MSAIIDILAFTAPAELALALAAAGLALIPALEPGPALIPAVGPTVLFADDPAFALAGDDEDEPLARGGAGLGDFTFAVAFPPRSTSSDFALSAFGHDADGGGRNPAFGGPPLPGKGFAAAAA